MVYKIASLVLGPVLYLQGKATRRSIPVLPEPDGAREGRIGNGRHLKILVLGDSAAAGVGAPSMQESLTGQLVEQLSDSFSVEWCLVAKTGATTASTLKRLKKHELGTFDVCVISLGVNDVTSGLSLKNWLIQQSMLREKLRADLRVKHIIICGLPPVHGFPSLPQPLRWWLGARATEFNDHLQKQFLVESNVRFLSLRFTEDSGLMADDGFHPGPAIYREWAIRVAELVKCSVNLSAGFDPQ